jgi:hypothetical protein
MGYFRLSEITSEPLHPVYKDLDFRFRSRHLRPLCELYAAAKAGSITI